MIGPAGPIDTSTLGRIALDAPAALRLVVLESPYAGNVAANLDYARRAMADSLARGEAPIASHALYTQPGVLDDAKPDERRRGIAAGLAWGRVASAAVFYVDLGMSPGMEAAWRHHQAAGLPCELRALDPCPVVDVGDEASSRLMGSVRAYFDDTGHA